MKVAVLGGGISGLMVARELADRPGTEIDLYERDSRLGGLLRSVRADGLEFDIGAFAFGHGHELLRSFPFLAGRMVPIHPRGMSVTPAGTLDGYPLTPRGFLRDHGVARAAVAGAGLLWGKVRHRRRDSVPAYARYYMGGPLYRWSGLPHYIERLYGIPDHQVALQLTEQTLVRIRDYTPLRLLRDRVRAWTGRAGPPRTMLVRPAEGFGAVWAAVGEDLAGRGVCIRLDAEVQRVERGPGGFALRVDGGSRPYDAVVSTIPIPVMLRLLGETPAMKFENAAMLSLFYRGGVRPDAAFLYNFSRRGRWKRITVFSRFYGPADGADWFTVEVTAPDTSPAALAELRADFEAHARDAGLTEGVPALVGQHVTERAYPVFRVGDPERVQAERRRLEAHGIGLSGRQGRFEYLSSAAAADGARRLAGALAREPRA